MAEHTQNTNTSPQIFAFDDQMVRTVERDGEYWFVAKDVALALDYRETEKMTRILDDDEAAPHIMGSDPKTVSNNPERSPSSARLVYTQQSSEAANPKPNASSAG